MSQTTYKKIMIITFLSFVILVVYQKYFVHPLYVVSAESFEIRMTMKELLENKEKIANDIETWILSVTPDLNNCDLDNENLTKVNYEQNGLSQKVTYKNGNSTTTLGAFTCSSLLARKK